MSCPGWRVHQHYEKEKRQAEQTGREARLNPCYQAQRGCDKAGAHEVRPEQMPRNPRRYEGRDDLRQREMFGAEGREWRRVEKRPEENQLVEAARLLPIAANKNHDQPDGKNQSEDKI